MPDHIFCNKCGHQNQLGSNFCSSCGAPLEQPVEHSTTINFTVDAPAEHGEEEVAVDVGEMPSDTGLLVVKRGPNAGSRFSLTGEVTTAGRHPDSDIFLDDITVSRRHAEITRSAGGYRVRDVGSLNGTYLNRERIEDGTLANGDELQVGKFKLVYFAGTGEEK
ncbi:hypothetical protein BH20ACT2_BH20ACT2_17290 [soil metagenome]